ncbi:unnamed protein product, partial [Polarella glacialis]
QACMRKFGSYFESSWLHSCRSKLEDLDFPYDLLQDRFPEHRTKVCFMTKVDKITGLSAASVSIKPVWGSRAVFTFWDETWQVVQLTSNCSSSYELGAECDVAVFYEMESEAYDFFKDDMDMDYDEPLSRGDRLLVTKAVDELLPDDKLWCLHTRCRDDIAELFCPPRLAAEARKRGLRASLSIDLVTGYDLRKVEDRKRATRELHDANPRLLLTCPPCSGFLQLQNLSGDSQNKEVKLSERINFLEYSMSEQQNQLDRGGDCLHEHPTTATSWRYKKVCDFLGNRRARTAKSHMCRFKLRVRKSLNKKSTTWATTSHRVFVALQKQCECSPGSHEPLIGGLAVHAAEYPQMAVKAIVDAYVQERWDQEHLAFHRLPSDEDLELFISAASNNAKHLEAQVSEGVFCRMRYKASSVKRNYLPGWDRSRLAWGESTNGWVHLERFSSASSQPPKLEGKYTWLCEWLTASSSVYSSKILESYDGPLSYEEKAAVMRCHVNCGPPPARELCRLLKAAGSRPEVINYVANEFSCDGCGYTKRMSARLPSATPRCYDFNVLVGVDIVEVSGVNETDKWPLLNCTCWGRLYSVFFPTDRRKQTGGIVWMAFCRSWLRVFGPMTMLVMDQGTNFMSNTFQQKCEEQGILVEIINRHSQFENGKTERRGGLFKDIYYRSRELAQPQSEEEVEILILECSWALQTLTNRSGYSPSQRALGKNPVVPFELSDGKIYTLSHDEDQAFLRASELRRFAKQAFIEVDARERVGRALNAQPRRARTAIDFQPGDLVEVWRSRQNKRKGESGKVGPCVVVLAQGQTVWVSRRGELWKCNRLQLFPISNAMKEGIENVGDILLKAKGRLRLDPHKLGFVDVAGEGPVPDDEGLPEDPDAQLRPEPADAPEAGASPDVELPQTLQPKRAFDEVIINTEDSDEEQPPVTAVADVASQSRNEPMIQEVAQAEDERPPSPRPTAPPASKEENTWCRIDVRARNFRTSIRNGPAWSQVYRRVTKDLNTGQVIEDVAGDELQTMPKGKLYRKLPAGVDAIETIQYYTPDRNAESSAVDMPLEEVSGQSLGDQISDLQDDAMPSSEGRVQQRMQAKRDYDQVAAAQPKMKAARRIFWDPTLFEQAQTPVVVDTGDDAFVLFNLAAPQPVNYVYLVDKNSVYVSAKGVKELSEKNFTPQQHQRFGIAKTTEIENLVGSNAVEIKLDEKWIQNAMKTLSHRFVERFSPTPATSTLMIAIQIICSLLYEAWLMDVKSAFGQSDELMPADGPLIATPPPGGFPGYPANCLILLKTAVYGLVNAPAWWRQSVRKKVLSLGYQESTFDPCLMFLPATPDELKYQPHDVENKFGLGVAGTVLIDVDDFLQGGNVRHHEQMAKLQKLLNFGKVKCIYKSAADYIGRTLSQKDDFEITVSMQRYADDKLRPITISAERKRYPEAKLDEREISQLRGGGGSVLWIGREGRPDAGAGAAMAMSWEAAGPTVNNILMVNKSIMEIKNTSEVHIRVLPIPIHSIRWAGVSDASLANVANEVSGASVKSQGGYLIAATTPEFFEGKMASLGSEALAMDDALAELEWAKALFNEVINPQSCIFDSTIFGVEETALVVKQVRDYSETALVTDARALFDSLTRRSAAGGVCRRSAVDIGVMSHSVKALNGKVFWVPGEIMLSDCPTKRHGNSTLLRAIMKSGRYGITKSCVDELLVGTIHEKANEKQNKHQTRQVVASSIRLKPQYDDTFRRR